MRYYQNELADNHGEVTGFQSACSEFAQKGLSLDERLNIGNPSIFILNPNLDLPSLQINKGDTLIFDKSLRPRIGDIVLIGGSLTRMANQNQMQDQVISGVLTAILKNFI